MDEEFDALQYIASYDDLVRAFGDNAELGERHYLSSGRAELRRSDAFDEEQYLAKYADLQGAFGDNGDLATLQYIRFGFAEGRNDDPPLPSSFDGLQYIASHNDLIDAFQTNSAAGEQHYLQFGRAEGRLADSFDEEQYLDNYPDLATAFGGDGTSATIHYILVGKAEPRTDAELTNNPPVAGGDTFQASEDSGSSLLAVLDNDSDPDAGDAPVVVSIGAVGTKGSVALGPGGVSYDPEDAFDSLAAGEVGTDTFTYTIADAGGGESTANVTVSIGGLDDQPEFTSDAALTVFENTTLVVALTAADPDADAATFTFAISEGEDLALFDIVDGNQLVFKAAPVFVPDVENEYLVQVTADGGLNGTATQDLTISVIAAPGATESSPNLDFLF